MADGCALPLRFRAPPPLIVGSRPLWVAAADIDADGKMDLVTTSQLSPYIGVTFGKGSTSFESLALYPTGPTEYMGQGVVADLTGDGLVDIAVASSTGVRVLVNRGNREFDEPITLPFDVVPIALTAAELSGDTLLDLAVVTDTYTVSVLLNQGGGMFAEPEAYLSGEGPRDVAAGDVNDDGVADLVVANGLGTSVSVLLNLGAGVFDDPVKYEVGSAPISVALIDLDADGDRDIAAANFGSNDVAVLLNREQGEFDPAVAYPVEGGSPYSLAATDLTHDGAPELVVANAGGSNVSLLVNGGDGSFLKSVDYLVGLSPVSVTLADFNGDSSVDIAAADYNYGDGSVAMSGLVKVLFNRCQP